MATTGFKVVRTLRPLLKIVDARAVSRSTNLIYMPQVVGPSFLTRSPYSFLHSRNFGLSSTYCQDVHITGLQETVSTGASSKKKLQRKKRTIIDRDDQQSETNPVCEFLKQDGAGIIKVDLITF